METKTTQYRQGDVLIERVDDDTDLSKATAVPREGGRIVLAHGEATGHAHAIASKFAALHARGAMRFLKVTRKVALDHEEHDRIELPAGTYRVTRQREYQRQAIRNVAD